MTTENPTSHPVRNASVGVVIVILLALLVFPGFLAAGLSRGKRPMVQLVPATAYSAAGDYFICDGPLKPALGSLFYPAEKLSQVSSAMREFYWWQYRLAEGSGLLIFGRTTAL